MKKLLFLLFLPILGFGQPELKINFGSTKLISTGTIEPIPDNCKHLKYSTFEVFFDTLHCMPYYSHELLTSKEVNTKATVRTNNFHNEPKIPCVNLKMYDKTYDRGHLTDAEDQLYSVKGEQDCFVMSNMTPQVPGFNRGIWKELENKVRKWADKYDSLEIYCAPLIDSSFTYHGLHVGKYNWKVIYSVKYNKGIAFIFPNAASSRPIYDYELPIDELKSKYHLQIPVSGSNIDLLFWK